MNSDNDNVMLDNDSVLDEQNDGTNNDGDELAVGNPYADKEKINIRIDKRLEIDRFQRSIFERGWFRNVLFYVGQQWIIFEKGRWRPRELPAWFPRAQSNKFAEKANDIISVLVQGRSPISYIPATDDPADQATAEVGERVREVMYTEAKIDDKEMELAAWLLLTGNGFLVPYYDMDKKNGVNFVQHEQCNVCNQVMSPADIIGNGGQCSTCQQLGASISDFKPAVDEETGEKVGDEFPIGALTTDVCSPFEIRLDHRIRNLEDHRYFIRVRRYDEDFAKEYWEDYEEDIVSDSGSSNDSSLSQHYLDILSQVTDAFNPAGGGVSTSAKGGSHKKKVTAYEFYELPSEDFPEGIRAVRLGTSANTIVEAGPLPTEYGAGIRKGQKFLPLIHFGFDIVPGRFWKKTRMDDMIPLQIFRNTVEANLRLSAQRMGNAIWLEPKGSGIDVITGEPGQKVKYNPVSMGGTSFAKPERVPAELSNLQPLIMLTNKIDDSMERIAGTFFLQGGDTPPGVTAASALAYLGERAQKSMSPLMREWAKGWRRFEEIGLEIARDNWDDTRIRVIAGKNKRWETQKFMSSDIQGAVNLVIDYNSLFPKSQATTRATIQQLISMEIINPADPEQNWKILSEFGETKLKGSIDIDVKEAVKEADDFFTSDIAPELIPMVQNSTVHLLQHTDFAKTDEFKELAKEKKDIWYAHIQATVADIVARKAAFASMGVDPNTPGLGEVSSGEANIAAQATNAMMPQADPAENAINADNDGQHVPKAPLGRNKPQPPMTPDIANGDAGDKIKGMQQPRQINGGQ